MAHLCSSSFDFITSVSQIADATNNTLPSITSVAGRNGTNGIRFDSNTGGFRILFRDENGAVVVSSATVFVGVAFRVETNTSTRSIFELWDGTTVQCALRIDSSNQLVFTRAGTTVLGTSTYIYPLGEQRWLEAKFVIADGTSGSIEVRVDGVVVFTVTGVDSKNSVNARATGIYFGVNASAVGTDRDHLFDDLVVYDDSGSSMASYTGDVRVEALRPNAAGDSAQWTPGGSVPAATNYQGVDETTPNDDTDYNASATVGHKDLFNLGALASSAGTIIAVKPMPRLKKDDAGTRTVKTVVKHGGVEASRAAVASPAGYAYQPQVYYVNPSTSAAWTPTEVNAAQAGYEVVS